MIDRQIDILIYTRSLRISIYKDFFDSYVDRKADGEIVMYLGNHSLVACR